MSTSAAPDSQLVAALADRYRVERTLGAGGMATVYLAQDLKHDRKVAIKVLKPELAAVLGAERFVVEIKTTAQLQHPHILPLFDSGTADGFLFYVMPYVQGETIRERLNRETQFAVDEAVRIARDVADALDYAHRHGVIHRDIKPENILLHDGRPMVMDFGIALAVSAAAGGRMTETGLSLGTPHYMSPEQATAEKTLTARSDVYSLGSVLYEMLSGNPPHTGASAQQIIMKIIAEPVDPVTKYRKSVPPHVAAAVSTSLEKVPADRFESAKAFADALMNPSYTTTAFPGVSADTRQLSAGLNWPFVVAASVAAIALAGWVWTALHPTTLPVKRTRFSVVVPDSTRIRPDIAGQDFTISPDGSVLAYLGGAATLQMYLRGLNDINATPISGTTPATQAKFSPDGKWLGFIQNRQLKKIPLPGGPAMSIAEGVTHFSWGDGDLIVFTRDGGLWRVNSAGGAPTLIAKADAKASASYGWPHVLPGGRSFVFDIVTAGNQAAGQLAAMRVDEGTVIPLGITGRNPRYVAGFLLFDRLDGTVVAAPFDAKRLRVTGPAVTVLEDVFVKSGGAGEFGVARDGTLFYVQGAADGDVVLFNPPSGIRTLLADRRGYRSPRFSPTSGRFALQVPDRTSYQKTDILVFNDLTSTFTRLTNDGKSTAPQWMADGERIVWVYRDSAGSHVRRQRWDGSGTPESLFPNDTAISQVVPSPAGNRFAVVKNGSFGDLYLAEGDPPSSVRPLVITPSGEGGPSFSPDGKWIAYYGDETGQREVYVIAANGDGGRHQISLEGGGEPLWAPDGKTLYYRIGTAMMAAGIVTTPAFAVTRREPVFGDRFRATGNAALYDVSRDGKTFLMIGNSSETTQRLMVVTGWLDELKERMAQATRE